MVEALVGQLSEVQSQAVAKYHQGLSRGELSWRTLHAEGRLAVLGGLLTDWLEQLKYPVLNCQHLCQIVIHTDNPFDCLFKFDFVSVYLQVLFRLSLKPLILFG